MAGKTGRGTPGLDRTRYSKAGWAYLGSTRRIVAWQAAHGRQGEAFLSEACHA